MNHPYGKRALLAGYMYKSAKGPLGAAAKTVAKGTTKAAEPFWHKALLGAGGNLAKGLGHVGKGIVLAGAKTIPWILAAPLLAGGAAGYAASEMTSPSGEDRAEAQKHLEEQALLQFKADIERRKKIRDFARKTLLEGVEGGGKKPKEREIRL